MTDVVAPAIGQKFGVVIIAGVAYPLSIPAGSDGTPMADPAAVGRREVFILATANVASAAVTVFGGDYVLAQKAGTYGSVRLEVLGPDGATYDPLVVKTAADATGGTGIALGSNAIVRAVLAGTTAANVTLSRVPA